MRARPVNVLGDKQHVARRAKLGQQCPRSLVDLVLRRGHSLRLDREAHCPPHAADRTSTTSSPTARRSQSASSRYVISSPYEGQRAQNTERVVRPTISPRSRDLPIPGGPRIASIPGLPVRSSSHDSTRRSLLPSDERGRRPCDSTTAETSMSTSRQAGTRPPFPLSSRYGTGTHTSASPISSRVVAPTRTPPAPAARRERPQCSPGLR